jgi:hypothetical protein
MSSGTLETILKVKESIRRQQEVVDNIRRSGDLDELRRQENILASLERRLEMLEYEQRMGH